MASGSASFSLWNGQGIQASNDVGTVVADVRRTTSGELERIFSSSKRSITVDRNRLGNESFEASQCMKHLLDQGLIDKQPVRRLGRFAEPSPRFLMLHTFVPAVT